jgi:hypothetical protein
MPLHDEGRRASALVQRPTQIERDGLKRPGDPASVGTLACTAEDTTVAWRRDRPGTRASLALTLITYDRTVVLQGDHVTLTPWPPDSGLSVQLYVAHPERFKRTQQLLCIDHLDEAKSRGGKS